MGEVGSSFVVAAFLAMVLADIVPGLQEFVQDVGWSSSLDQVAMSENDKNVLGAVFPADALDYHASSRRSYQIDQQSFVDMYVG